MGKGAGRGVSKTAKKIPMSFMDGSQPPWDPFSHLWIVFKNVFLNRKISIIWTNSIISSSFAICHIIDTCNSIDVKCKLSNGHSVNVYEKKNPKERRKLAAECVWPVDNERVTKSCQSHSRAQAIFTVCPTKNVNKFYTGHTVICGQCACKVKEKSDGRDPFGQAKPKQR